jgi:tetratricopeptide (TPR) repeat protein
MSLTAIDTTKPLITCSRELFLESKDITCFKNLDIWASELDEILQEKVFDKKGVEQINLDFEVFCNQFSLLLFLNGQSQKSISMCSQLVSFYKHLFKQHKNYSYLEKAIQPIINWSRAYRITGNGEMAFQIFAPINVIERKGEVQICKQRISYQSFKTNVQDVLVYNSIAEPLKIFLRMGNFQGIFDYLETLKSQNQANRSICLEARIVALISCERFEEACNEIVNAMQTCHGNNRLKFYFRLAEVLVETGDISQARQTLSNLKQKIEGSLVDFKWSDLLFVNRVVELAYLVLDADEVASIHIQLIETYRKHADEFNYLQQILLLKKNAPHLSLDLSESSLHDLLRNSGYARLRSQFRSTSISGGLLGKLEFKFSQIIKQLSGDKFDGKL